MPAKKDKEKDEGYGSSIQTKGAKEQPSSFLSGGMFEVHSAHRMSQSAHHKQRFVLPGQNPGAPHRKSVFPQCRRRRGNIDIYAFSLSRGLLSNGFFLGLLSKIYVQLRPDIVQYLKCSKLVQVQLFQKTILIRFAFLEYKTFLNFKDLEKVNLIPISIYVEFHLPSAARKKKSRVHQKLKFTKVYRDCQISMIQIMRSPKAQAGTQLLYPC